MKLQAKGNYFTVRDSSDIEVFTGYKSKISYRLLGNDMAVITNGSDELTLDLGGLTNGETDLAFADASAALLYIQENTGFNPASGGSEATEAKTGSTIVFTENAVYNEGSPVSGDLILDNTGQVEGVVAAIHHRSSTKPDFTIPTGKKLYYEDGEYISNNTTLNIIYITTTPDGDYYATIRNYDDFWETIDYVAEVDTVIAAAELAGDEVPKSQLLNKISNFITELKSLRDDADTVNTDVFALLDGLQIYMGSTEDFSKYDFVTGTKDASSIDAITYNATHGYLGDGTADALNTGVNLSTDATNYTLNNCSLIVYQTAQTNTGYFAGALNGAATNRTQIGINIGTGSWQLSLNSGALAYSGTYEEGTLHLDRSDSANVKFHINGSLETTQALASTGIPDVDVYVAARNFTGANTPTDGFVGLMMYGASLDGYQGNIHAAIVNNLL